MLQYRTMNDDRLQDDFFKGQFSGEKVKKPHILTRYSKHRVLPHVRIPVEHTVIIAIGVLVLVIISYAVGVEKGKRMTSLKPVEISQTVLPESDIISEVTEVSEPEELAESLAETQDIAKEAVPEEEFPQEEDEPEELGPPDSVYIIQLASFKNEDSANEEIGNLWQKNVRAYVAKSGDWYQVYVAGYQTIEEARRARRAFSEDYRDCYIRKIK